MGKLNSVIITHKINEEVNDACYLIYFGTRPIFGKERKAIYDDKLSDAWCILREYLGDVEGTLTVHKLVRRGFAVELTDE